MKTTYQVAGNEIIHEVLDNEVIIANLDSGIYYSIRESGVPIWQLLISAHSLEEISSIIAEKHSIKLQDAMFSLEAFIEQLLDERLLVVFKTEQSAHAISGLIWPIEFKKPVLEKYEEMKALLMLDPIHEVDEQGWPSKS